MDYLKAFLVGGALCIIGQLLLDLTKMTPARILVSFVVAGAIASGLGLYGPLVEFAGAGATVPLCGFGHALTQGTMKAVSQNGWLGLFTGGISSTAAGVAAALIFGYLAALFFQPKTKT